MTPHRRSTKPTLCVGKGRSWGKIGRGDNSIPKGTSLSSSSHLPSQLAECIPRTVETYSDDLHTKKQRQPSPKLGATHVPPFNLQIRFFPSSKEFLSEVVMSCSAQSILPGSTSSGAWPSIGQNHLGRAPEVPSERDYCQYLAKTI